jgi:hypothetical protein
VCHRIVRSISRERNGIQKKDIRHSSKIVPRKCE